MAIVTVPAMASPFPFLAGNAAPITLIQLTLNSAGFKAAFIFRAPKAGNIHKIGAALSTITTPTDTDFRLETVSAQFPTGTLQGTNTNSTIVSGSLAANVMNMATLTADATVAAGDLLAIVVVPSGSPNFIVSALSLGSLQSPYSALFNGAWSASTGGPICAVEYSDGSYALIAGVSPLSTANTHTYNSGSTPDEIGARFRVPVSQRIAGGWVPIDIDNSLDIVLYDSDGVTPLATAPLTNAGRRTTTGVTPLWFMFPSAVTLLANTYYYLSVKPGASNISIYSWDMLTAAALDQLPGGQDWHYVSAKDPSGTGSWTAITTRYPIMGLLVDGIAGATSGGGSPFFVVND